MLRKKILYPLFFLISVSSLSAQEMPQDGKDSAYFASTLRSFIRGNNTHRYRFVKNYATKEGLQKLAIKTEAIDWLGIYRNVIVEKKGESDSIVYVVCHYDKTDGNILAVINILINGELDILFSNTYLSKGAYDNGTGVVTSLGLLSWINSQSTHYTYRFLFTGMEESGLRGSRRHISGLSKTEWNRCFYAINIDMVGKKGTKGITVTQDVSDSSLVRITRKICKTNQYNLVSCNMPIGAATEYLFFRGQSFGNDVGISLLFNITGALFPQRSYFTGHKKGIPVINFTDDAKLWTIPNILSVYSPISFGEIHSFRDQPKVVDANNLVVYHNFLKEFLLTIDNQKSLVLNYNSPAK